MNKTVLAIESHDALEQNNEHKDLVVSNCGYSIVNNLKFTANLEDDNNDWLLLYQHKGSLEVPINDKLKFLSEGHILIIPPNVWRYYTFTNNPINERYFVYFKGIKSKKLLQELHLLDSPSYYVGDLTPYLHYFHKIIDDFKIHDFTMDTFRITYLLRLLTHLSLIVHPIATKQSQQQTLEPAIELMKNEYHSQITLAKCAKSCNMSIRSFSRLWKNTYSVPPITFLEDIRIQKAIYFLTTTNMSIYNIAQSVGYKNALYFSNIFKKHTHFSPSEYRKQILPPPRN